jgi:hypothetical protein
LDAPLKIETIKCPKDNRVRIDSLKEGEGFVDSGVAHYIITKVPKALKESVYTDMIWTVILPTMALTYWDAYALVTPIHTSELKVYYV